MYDILAGIRVVELSMYAFVPSAGAVLADWGADVIKVLPLDGRDPMLGKGVVADLPEPRNAAAFMWNVLNRGKRSISLDITTDAGYDVLTRLVSEADVFMTNLLPDARQRLRVDAADMQALRPDLVYARGTGQGSRGPEAGKGAFDATAFWVRAGIAHIASQMSDEFLPLISPAFGDTITGLALASGITGALLRRERTGQGAVVDVSLLAAGMYAMGPSIAGSELHGVPTIPRSRHADLPNPFVAPYETKDGRHIMLASMRTDLDWAGICDLLGMAELADDVRFIEASDRSANRQALISALDTVFASRTLDEWKTILANLQSPWTIAQTALETHTDPQTIANGYITGVETKVGDVRIVTSPVQFDDQPTTLRRAPDPGEHTDEILTELGFTDDQIIELKIAEAVL